MKREILAGVLMVRLASALGAQTSLPVWKLTPELRIDGVAENLSSINPVSVSRGGTIVIGQPQDHQVLFYSTTGKRLAAFGRNGDGPGEFRGIGLMGWIGDTLWENSSNRFTYISPQYKLVRVVPQPPYPAPTAAELAIEEKDPCSVHEGGGSRTNPFCAKPKRNVAADSSYLVTVAQTNPTSAVGTYTVTVTRHSSEKVFSRSYTTPGVAIPKQYADSMVKLMRRGGGADFFAATMPKYFAPVQAALVGDDGTVWVLLWTPPGAIVRQYVVIGANGTALATLTLPKSVTPQVVRRNTMWGYEADADGLESVVRYRVQ